MLIAVLLTLSFAQEASASLPEVTKRLCADVPYRTRLFHFEAAIVEVYKTGAFQWSMLSKASPNQPRSLVAFPSSVKPEAHTDEFECVLNGEHLTFTEEACVLFDMQGSLFTNPKIRNNNKFWKTLNIPAPTVSLPAGVNTTTTTTTTSTTTTTTNRPNIYCGQTELYPAVFFFEGRLRKVTSLRWHYEENISDFTCSSDTCSIFPDFPKRLDLSNSAETCKKILKFAYPGAGLDDIINIFTAPLAPGTSPLPLGTWCSADEAGVSYKIVNDAKNVKLAKYLNDKHISESQYPALTVVATKNNFLALYLGPQIKNPEIFCNDPDDLCRAKTRGGRLVCETR